MKFGRQERMKVISVKGNLSFGKRLWRDMHKNWILYVMILPVLLYYIIYNYVPMYGVLMAFKDYKIKKGILGSPWVGFKHFTRFFNAHNFESLLINTIEIGAYSFFATFPVAIIFAVMCNYLTNQKLKKATQMVSYAPYFISMVVLCGMIKIFGNADTGIFNIVRNFFGLESVDWLSKASWFKDIYVWSGVWQTMGWSAIIYISTLSSVDMNLHEAAIMDGATKLQRIRHVDFPCIRPMIVMNLIMSVGSLLAVNFEKIILLQNSLNSPEAEVLASYTYKIGLVQADYAFSSAVGLFSNVTNLILLTVANLTCRLVAKEGLF